MLRKLWSVIVGPSPQCGKCLYWRMETSEEGRCINGDVTQRLAHKCDILLFAKTFGCIFGKRL